MRMDEQDPDRVRVLTPAERSGERPPDETPTLRERLTAAKRALRKAERGVATCSDLVAYLETQLAEKQ